MFRLFLISFFQSIVLAMNLSCKDKCIAVLSSPKIDSADCVLLTNRISKQQSMMRMYGVLTGVAAKSFFEKK